MRMMLVSVVVVCSMLNVGCLRRIADLWDGIYDIGGSEGACGNRPCQDPRPGDGSEGPCGPNPCVDPVRNGRV